MARGKADAEGGKVSKRKMVEQALQELGNVGPKELQAHIQKAHGVEIGSTMLSSYKSQILRKQGGGGGGGGGRGGDAALEVKDVAALRELIDRVGAGELQTLIKVLSK